MLSYLSRPKLLAIPAPVLPVGEERPMDGANWEDVSKANKSELAFQ